MKYSKNNQILIKNNIGRYVSPDSFDYFSYLMDENLYSYSENNPSNKYDITGHYVIDESCRCKEPYDPFKIHKAIRFIKNVGISRADARACIKNIFDPASDLIIECGRSCQRANDAYSRGSMVIGLCPPTFERGFCEIVWSLVHEALHSCFFATDEEAEAVSRNAYKKCLKQKGLQK